jgi:tRNA(Ile)-lysidine synthase
VALSGGVDSIVMLELARAAAPQLGVQIDALHVNHGLSPHADRWERFCRGHCGRRRIPIACVRVKVGGGGANVEAEARAARYAAFAHARSTIVVLAHHQDDQAETLLLQLMRGAGLRGLSAMPVRRALGVTAGRAANAQTAPVLLRPLLGVTRHEIERYAARKRLRWIQDESNAEDRYARNFLRVQVLPRLERRFPGCRAALARAAAHLATASRLLDQLAAIDGARAINGDRISVSCLQALEPARAANLLRAFIVEHGLEIPSSTRLNEILYQLCNARRDANPQLRLGERVLRRFQGWIELSREAPVDNRAAVIRWTGESRIALADDGELRVRSVRGRGVSREKLGGGTVTIRRRQGGERMRLNALRPRRTLKNLLQEAGVQPWLRSRMPLVFHNEELVWAPGIGVAWEFRARGTERSLLFSWNQARAEPGR